MKIYLVKLNEWSWDEYDGFVVAAKSEDEAIAYIRERHSESSVDWGSGYTVTEVKASGYDIPTEILCSFNAG